MSRNLRFPAAAAARDGSPSRARPGFGLISVLLIMLLAGAIASAAVMFTTGTLLVNSYAARESTLDAAADDGLEQARAQLNGDKTLYSDTGFVLLRGDDHTVKDASGATIPGVTRNIWVGPLGIGTGQFGVFGSVVVEVTDGDNDRVVRREALVQESFAKFAYFTNDEGVIVFGNHDVIQGPVHSNDDITIDATHATFTGQVTTAKTVVNIGNGTFTLAPPKQHVPIIPFPTMTDLNKLATYATAGHTYIDNAPTTGMAAGQAKTRIEFVWRDLNGDGRVDNDEAFMRVYDSSDYRWVVADAPSDGDLRETNNCGDFHWVASVSDSILKPARKHTTSSPDSATIVLTPPGSRTYFSKGQCFLGGDPHIFGGTFTDSTKGTSSAVAADSVFPRGGWRAWPGTIDARVQAQYPKEAKYLFPLSHDLNPTFKGVIYVNGRVAISGVVHGHITLAATDNIIIADNLSYAYVPGAGGCQDLLGLFSGTDIVVADNVLNTPSQINGSGTYYAYGMGDVTINAVILALGSFTAEDYNSGTTSGRTCNTDTDARGCLRLTGGVIQETRGAVGMVDGHGFIKSYSYDTCAAIIPPPYFPTTGRFARGAYYEVNPTTNLRTYFEDLMSH
jgi:hypothetical protein